MLRNIPNIPKNRKGFTLVEVIVVAVIVAVLAAVAIPLYLGYVKDSRINSAANAAGSVATFCGACMSTSGTLTPAPNGGTVGGTLTCTSANNTITSIQIPTDIEITITPGDANHGTVTGRHVASDDTEFKSFNY
jgi:prepilin-type N-terminal cleavage/methylation domain-containing protein